jgi:hypothetical protein
LSRSQRIACPNCYLCLTARPAGRKSYLADLRRSGASVGMCKLRFAALRLLSRWLVDEDPAHREGRLAKLEAEIDPEGKLDPGKRRRLALQARRARMQAMTAARVGAQRLRKASGAAQARQSLPGARPSAALGNVCPVKDVLLRQQRPASCWPCCGYRRVPRHRR